MARNESANKNQEENEDTTEFDIPYTINLKTPIVWGEETRTTIVINRRLKAKDFKGIRASDIRFDDMMKLVSRVTAEPIKFIEEMDAADLFEATQVVQSFLPSGLTTGENR
jgi:hypothetical protein